MEGIMRTIFLLTEIVGPEGPMANCFLLPQLLDLSKQENWTKWLIIYSLYFDHSIIG